MSEDEINEIEARANAATEGPWGPHEMPPLSGALDWLEIGPYPDAPVAEVTADYDNFRANAEFIAHARTDIPRLIAALREARIAAAEARNQ